MCLGLRQLQRAELADTMNDVRDSCIILYFDQDLFYFCYSSLFLGLHLITVNAAQVWAHLCQWVELVNVHNTNRTPNLDIKDEY